MRKIKNKFKFIIFCLYLLVCISLGINSLILHNLTSGVMGLCFSLFVPLVVIVEKWLHIKIPNVLLCLLLFLAIGSVLGTGYGVYSKIPFFDSLLHFLSGIIFACLGYTLMNLVIGKIDTNKKYFACVLFGFFFSLAIASLWEIFEYTINQTLGFDMLEDTMINHFNSYYLMGNHNEYMEVQNVEKTIIYFGEGKVLELNGYLDLGVIDTLTDMIVCLFGAILFLGLVIFSEFKVKWINNCLLPKIDKKNDQSKI